jgi:hypothetical protein
MSTTLLWSFNRRQWMQSLCCSMYAPERLPWHAQSKALPKSQARMPSHSMPVPTRTRVLFWSLSLLNPRQNSPPNNLKFNFFDF